MDLAFSDSQELMRSMVRGVCAEHSQVSSVRALEDDPKGYSEDFWKMLGEVDLHGLSVPSQYGGMGASLLDAAIVYEELGRALAPSPHFVSGFLSASILTRLGSDEQKQTWLPSIVSGEAILTPAWCEPGRTYDSTGVSLEARPDGDDFLLSGTKRHVQFARAATRLVVLARTGEADDAVDLFLVDPAAAGVTRSQQLSLASDTQYELRFDNVRVPASDRLGAAGTGWSHWHGAMLEGAVLQAAYAVGGALEALEKTTEFSVDRHQFGKPLAAFQSLSHYMADAATQIDGAQGLVWEAAWAASEGAAIRGLAPMAKLFACNTFREATRTFQQIWGGVGFTTEYDIQLYFRRAQVLQLSWWDPRHLKKLIAAEVLDS